MSEPASKREWQSTGSASSKPGHLAKPAGKPPPAKSFMRIKASAIKVKEKRTEVYRRQKAEKKRVKKEERKVRKRQREAMGDDAPPPKVAKTQDNTRERDDTVVAADDDEVKGDEAMDEFAEYFEGASKPKVMITTCLHPTKRMYAFVRDLLRTIPNSQFYKRRNFELELVTKYASERGYTDLVVINEDRKKFNGWTQFHLPNGPSAKFKLSSVVLSDDIQDRGRINLSRPEVILNNFGTRLGHRVGRVLGSLFEQTPHFEGRRVVTFHNQRDFVFFRHHRYIFDDDDKRRDGKKARLQELGPQFTLKLKALHSGIFDDKHGEYEWYHKNEMDTSRKRFFL